MVIDTAKALYNNKIKVKDPDFDVDKLAQYELTVEVSDRDLFLFVVDTVSTKAVFLEHYVFQDSISDDEALAQLSLLYDDHHFLKAGFWKEIKFVIKNNKFAFVPNALYEESKRKAFLELNADLGADDYIFTSPVNSANAKCVYAINGGLYNWLRSLYPSKEIVLEHGCSSFINGIYKHIGTGSQESFYVYTDSSTLTLVVMKENQLQYCNLFSFANTEDLVYYIMLIMHEFNLNPEVVPVSLLGEIDQTDIHFAKLKKYIRFLNFGKRPESMKFGYVFDECFDHQYFALFSNYQQNS